MSQINSNTKDDFQVVFLMSCFVGHPVLICLFVLHSCVGDGCETKLFNNFWKTSGEGALGPSPLWETMISKRNLALLQGLNVPPWTNSLWNPCLVFLLPPLSLHCFSVILLILLIHFHLFMFIRKYIKTVITRQKWNRKTKL